MAAADDDTIAGAPDRPCGYGRWATQLTAAMNLATAPTDGTGLGGAGMIGRPNRALIMCETQDVRWTDDESVDPTATVGMLLKVNTLLSYTGDLSKLRFIQVAATAVLHVSFYNS